MCQRLRVKALTCNQSLVHTWACYYHYETSVQSWENAHSCLSFTQSVDSAHPDEFRRTPCEIASAHAQAAGRTPAVKEQKRLAQHLCEYYQGLSLQIT